MDKYIIKYLVTRHSKFTGRALKCLRTKTLSEERSKCIKELNDIIKEGATHIRVYEYVTTIDNKLDLLTFQNRLLREK